MKDEFVPPQLGKSGETIVDLRSLALGRMPKAVQESMDGFLESWKTDNLSAWWKEWWSAAEKLAEQHVRPLLNAEPGQSILVPNVTHVLHQLLSAPELHVPGKRGVVTTDREFPTVYDVIHNENHRFLNLPPDLRDQLAFRMQQVEGFDAQGIMDKIDDTTALVVLPHVASFTGELFDQQAIRQIVEKADRHGVFVVVDGSQAIASTRIDVQKMRPHIYTGTLLKQGCGAQNGYVYVRPDVSLDPTNGGWVGTESPFTHGDGKTRRTPSPSIVRRFYGVGTPQIAPLYHATQGLEIFGKIGHEEVVRDVRAKAAWIIGKFAAAEMPLVSPADPEKASALIVLRASQAEKVRDALQEKGILVTGQEDIIRLAPHVYHPIEDIERATEAIIKTFK